MRTFLTTLAFASVAFAPAAFAAENPCADQEGQAMKACLDEAFPGVSAEIAEACGDMTGVDMKQCRRTEWSNRGVDMPDTGRAADANGAKPESRPDDATRAAPNGGKPESRPDDATRAAPNGGKPESRPDDATRAAPNGGKPESRPDDATRAAPNGGKPESRPDDATRAAPNGGMPATGSGDGTCTDMTGQSWMQCVDTNHPELRAQVDEECGGKRDSKVAACKSEAYETAGVYFPELSSRDGKKKRGTR